MKKALILLACAVALALCAGCASGNGIGSAAVAKAAKAQGAAEYADAAAFRDGFLADGAAPEQMRQGAFITVTGDALLALINDASVGDAFGLPVSRFTYDVSERMERATFYRVGDVDGGGWTMLVFSIDFDDETAALSFHSNMGLQMKAAFAALADDIQHFVMSGSKDGVTYDTGRVTDKTASTTTLEGLYYRGKSVLMAVCTATATEDGEDAVYAFCGKLGIPSPTQYPSR